MKKVFVLGSLNMDLVINAPREVLQGETVHGSGFMTNPGGKGANQAVACGKLGADVTMGGCVGRDAFGTELIRNITACGVRSAIRSPAGVPTGVAVIVVTGGDNRIILDSGANAVVTRADVDTLLADAVPGDFFLTQLENPVPLVGYALRAAREKGLCTVLNPAPMDTDILPYLPFVDIFMPNEHEFRDVTGTDDLKAGAEKLLDGGASAVIVTLGARGYCLCTRDGLQYGQGIAVKAVDTTAAGDTFCGAFVTRLSLGDGMQSALTYANAAAALTVTKRGAQQAIPTAAEVTQFLQQAHFS